VKVGGCPGGLPGQGLQVKRLWCGWGSGGWVILLAWVVRSQPAPGAFLNDHGYRGAIQALRRAGSDIARISFAIWAQHTCQHQRTGPAMSGYQPERV
jgi:hypothetical protein